MAPSTEPNEISVPTPPERSAGALRAEKAMQEFLAGRNPGPNPGSVSFGRGYVSVFVFGDKIHLGNIFVHPRDRHKGYGGMYLKVLLDIVDKHGVTLSCHVAPYGPQNPETKMGKRELNAWYLRKGFQRVPYQSGYFMREPGATASVRRLPQVPAPS